MREQEVLKLRQKGLTQVEVSSKLKISQAAVSSFEKNALRKVEDAKLTLETFKKLSSQTPNERSG